MPSTFPLAGRAPGASSPSAGRWQRAVTFRTLATAMDFTTNYVVVGDVASAVLLSATGFVLGPFVYYGHEKAWDYFNPQVNKQVDMPASA
jgi:uncharacterized membrane protein